MNGIHVRVKKIGSRVHYFLLSTKVGVNPNPIDIGHAIIIIIIIDDNTICPTHCAMSAARRNCLELIHTGKVEELKAVLGNL
jgi:hypothetical protein